MAAHPEFILLNDEPDDAVGDPLDFEDVAGDLADTILRSRASSPLTLGIEGGWGTGKSSLMRKLARRLDDDPGVTIVWFNAWAAEGNSALEGLIKTVLQEVDPRSIRKAARQERVLTAGRAGSMLLGRWLGLSQAVDVVWEQVAKDARARNSLRRLMHEALAGWRHKHARDGVEPLMVVFVDDLDRASPEQIFEVFEAVKLYLDAKGLAFVVGYDQTVISEAVLAEKKYSADVTGRQYLEKIVQVGYRITPPDDDHALALATAYTQRSGTAELFDEAALRLMIDRNQRNPRRIKRFLNSFVLLYSLDADWRQLGPKCLLDVLLLDTHFPEFMALFRAGTDADPVGEFVDYHTQMMGADEEDIDSDATLARLQEMERHLPEQYTVLIQNDEFVRLVRSLHKTDRWDDIRLKLQRRRAVVVELPSKADDEEAAVDKRMPNTPRGRVLWLVDHPDNANQGVALVLWIERQGWEVARRPLWRRHRITWPEYLPLRWTGGAVVKALEQPSLRSRGFDVVVVEGDGRDDARVLATLRFLRLEDGFRGPMVALLPRVTPEIRAQVEGLGAAVTSDLAELERYLHLLARHGFEVEAPGTADTLDLQDLPLRVAILAEEAGTDPERRSSYASVLTDLATLQWSSGKQGAATETRRQAAEVYEALAEEADRGGLLMARDTYRQAHLRSLRSLADYCREIGDEDGALEARIRAEVAAASS